MSAHSKAVSNNPCRVLIIVIIDSLYYREETSFEDNALLTDVFLDSESTTSTAGDL